MMRLQELDPRWLALESGGPRVGFSFDCPHCRTQRLAVLFHHSGSAQVVEEQYIRAHYPNDAAKFIWEMNGSYFSDMTLNPSVDASSCGHWHGFILSGEIR